MPNEIPKHYVPSEVEGAVFKRWREAGAFAAVPGSAPERYVIMMPLPNVTGALHMGHAMDNVMQDLLIRWHRMMGHDTLWMAGTDHAGIATQAVVEKRLFELEGKTRHDIGREALCQRIWEWKEQYQKRIIGQLQSMGCSADWDRLRFTMDEVCARAVRFTFFRMFRDGLIHRANRLVNWDCQLQTAVADDEIVYEEVQGGFWYLRYPVIDPGPGEPGHVVVATTRPETMLGDTAVACHPDPQGALESLIRETREKLQAAPQRERAALEEELQGYEARRETHLPVLRKLAAMARDGRRVLLPLLDRPIPLILDEWAKPGLGSGCVKITPAHDPNDFDVWQRHAGEIESINILNPDGTLNQNAGPYSGLDRFAARDRVVEDLKKLNLLDSFEEHAVEVGHSDRSKTPIEPYLSLQWFVRMGDVEGGIVCGRGTEKEFRAPGLAQAAMDAAGDRWRSPTGRSVRFHPDGDRYKKTYLSWLAEKRDWCISRQLWWGHRIPIWRGSFSAGEVKAVVESLREDVGEHLCARIVSPDGKSHLVEPGPSRAVQESGSADVLICLLDRKAEEAHAAKLEGLGLTRDPDVLDTWFSSALWPHSTLGWPDPATAAIEEGQAPLGPAGGRPDCLSAYYPGSCLVTGRDIITLWIARMIITGLYNLGDVPFTDVFVHANILDGKGVRMSKSKGNGIDPVDIIEKYGADAMRYTICDMQTGTQDIRLPVQAISPYTGDRVELATAKHGRTIYTYICPGSGKEFDVLGTMPDVPLAKLESDRFEAGVNFSTKLWNAARFAFMNLEGYSFSLQRPAELPEEDRWILSRLSRVIGAVQGYLEAYNPSAALAAARNFFWSELCDWYLELIKPRMRDGARAPAARQVLAAALDQVLRLLHPFTPYITEVLWERLNAMAPRRGVEAELPPSELLVRAAWPTASADREDDGLEKRFTFMQEVVKAIREVRAKFNIPFRQSIAVRIGARGDAAASLRSLADLVTNVAGLESLEIAEEVEHAASAAVRTVGATEIHVLGVVDVKKEIARLQKERDSVSRRLESSRKKLANEKFVARAQPEVVQRERERLVELEAELKTIETNLKKMTG